MKKLFLLIVVSLFSAAAINAQTNQASLKKEIKMDKKDIKIDKKDGNKTAKKEDRKALRKLQGTEVSYQSKLAFAKDFDNIKATSSRRRDYFDEFQFTQNGKPKIAFYDDQSDLVGTVQNNKKFTDLPMKGQENIRKDYPDYTPGNVVFFDDNEQNESDMLLFGQQFDGSDSYFVEMIKGSKKIVLHVMMDGQTNFFADLK